MAFAYSTDAQGWAALAPAHDLIILGGAASPGVCKINGAAREVAWEVKMGEGESGETATRKGEPLSKFTIEFSLWVDDQRDHIAEWENFAKMFVVTRLEKPKALDIYHPDLARLGITSVVVPKEGCLKHDGKGGATVEVEFLEYRPPKPKKAGGAAGSTRGNGLLGDIGKDMLIGGAQAVDPLLLERSAARAEFLNAPATLAELTKLVGATGAKYAADNGMP